MIRQELAPEFAFTDPLQGEGGDAVGDIITNAQLVLRIRSGGDPHGLLILELMQRNSGFIYKMAKPFTSILDKDEIPSVAFLAMSRAVDYWTDDYSFLTMLGKLLIHELLAAANNTRNAPLYWKQRDRLHRFYKLRKEYFDRFGREPCDDEIMKSLKITPEQLKDLRQCVAIQDNAMRLDEPVETEDGTADSIGDLIPGNTAPVDTTATDLFYQAELQAALFEALDRLPENQSRAIRSRYFEGGAADTKTIHNGLTALSKERQLAGFLNENFFSGNGLAIFQHSWTSGPERMIVQHGTKPRRKGDRVCTE